MKQQKKTKGIVKEKKEKVLSSLGDFGTRLYDQIGRCLSDLQTT